MQQFAERQSDSVALSDMRSGTVITNRHLNFLIIGHGNPRGIGPKLGSDSRTLKNNRVEGPFDKVTCLFCRVYQR